MKIVSTYKEIDLRTFLRTIFDRGYKSSFLSGFVKCVRFRIPARSLKMREKTLKNQCFLYFFTEKRYKNGIDKSWRKNLLYKKCY